MLQILKICLFTTKDNYPNFFSTYTQLKVSLQMKNENQNKTCLGRKKERKHIVVKKIIITVYNTPGVGKVSDFHFTAKIVLSFVSLYYS